MTILDKQTALNETKDAIYETLHCSEKPLKAISCETNIGLNHLTRSALKGPSGCNFQLEWIPLVTLSANNFIILDTLEHMVGRVGIPLPPQEGISTADVCRLTIKSVAEFGELMREVERAVADEKIKPAEREHIIREGYHAVQAILHLMESCKRD